MLIPLLIFAATYVVLAIGRLPGFRVDRTGAAIIGASLMLAANVLTIQEAYGAIDYDTILLLFGMMIVVANLRLAGSGAIRSGQCPKWRPSRGAAPAHTPREARKSLRGNRLEFAGDVHRPVHCAGRC